MSTPADDSAKRDLVANLQLVNAFELYLLSQDRNNPNSPALHELTDALRTATEKTLMLFGGMSESRRALAATAASSTPAGMVLVPIQALQSIADSSGDANARGFAQGLLAAAPATAATHPAPRAAPLAVLAEQPAGISDEEIDRIAALTEKAMPDGLRGFMRTWGWQQFAHLLIENLRPYGLRRDNGEDALNAARWRWLAPRLIAADFDWQGQCVLVFDWPRTVGVGGSCAQNVDAAMADAAHRAGRAKTSQGLSDEGGG